MRRNRLTSLSTAAAVVVVIPLLSLSGGCSMFKPSDQSVIAQANQVHGQLAPAVIKDPEVDRYMDAIGRRIIEGAIQILRTAERTQRFFNFIMVGIAAFALVVGGIGIMNIMLASVTERTREIGIRRALGAKRKHITLQFLIETTVISLTGGLIGILIGSGFAKSLPFIVEFFSSGDQRYPTVIATWSVIGSFAVSGLIGIGFGLYPAVMAAHMNPIEALRHE